MSIDDERDLYERLDGAVAAITPGSAPVDSVMRHGRVIRWRRRSVAVASVAAVVAAGVLAAPSLRHAATENPATSHYTATVRPPWPGAPAGVFAQGTVNGRHWQLTVGQAGTDGAERGQQIVIATGPAFGSSGVGMTSTTPAFSTPASDPVSFYGFTSEPSQAAYGPVAADVSYVRVRLGNGVVLTLHPVRAYGVRMVGFAIPVGAPVVSATAYSARGEIATAIPFNAAAGTSTFSTWLKPGQHGLARVSARIGLGTYLGSAWSARVYLGPWGVCLTGQGGGTSASTCMETTTGTGLGTEVVFWTAGVPPVAVGTSDRAVDRIVVAGPDGTTMQVRPVTVDGVKFFAFPFGKEAKTWKWTAYDGAGHAIASGKVTPEPSKG